MSSHGRLCDELAGLMRPNEPEIIFLNFIVRLGSSVVTFLVSDEAERLYALIILFYYHKYWLKVL